MTGGLLSREKPSGTQIHWEETRPWGVLKPVESKADIWYPCESEPNGKGETGMNRRAVVIPVIIIVNACIWGLAILMTAHTLKGTGAYQQIQHILGGCAGVSLVVVGGGLAAVAKITRSAEDKDRDAPA
jgi:hypothetical protein